jgi:hypothetical protein
MLKHYRRGFSVDPPALPLGRTLTCFLRPAVVIALISQTALVGIRAEDGAPAAAEELVVLLNRASLQVVDTPDSNFALEAFQVEERQVVLSSALFGLRKFSLKTDVVALVLREP